MTVNGEVYKMRLTASTIMQIEKKLDKPLFKVLETIQDNIACVAVNDPNRSPEGDFITAT